MSLTIGDKVQVSVVGEIEAIEKGVKGLLYKVRGKPDDVRCFVNEKHIINIHGEEDKSATSNID